MLFVVLTMMAGLLVLLTVWAVRQESGARRKLEETAQTDRTLSLVLIDLLNAETGVRGYVLSQDADYLTPYYKGTAEVPALLGQLEGLARGATDQGEQLAGLRALVRRKLSLMERTLQLNGDIGQQAATAFVATNAGRETMDRIRSQIAAMQDTINRSLRADLARLSDLLWWKNAGLLGLALATFAALVLTGILIRRAAAAEVLAEQAVHIRAERDRADLVSRELSHRVKNLFAVIMSIISTTGRTETDPREAARKTRERVQALARAHALSTGQRELRDTALRDLVVAVAGPYAPSPDRIRVEGPDIVLESATVTPLGLILNELATNALKYGCWAGAQGTLNVVWSLMREDGQTQNLRIIWTENAPGFVAPPASPTRGFGTTVIELSAAQANATVERTMTDGGIMIVLALEPGRPVQPDKVRAVK